jgi:hypothetical protein
MTAAMAAIVGPWGRLNIAITLACLEPVRIMGWPDAGADLRGPLRLEAAILSRKAGRQARLIEFDPAYCDQILHRFERATGKPARLATNGQSFEVVAEARRSNRTCEGAAP